MEALSNKGLCLVRGALPLLGSVVGVEAESVQHWVANEIKSWRKVLPLLARKELSVQLSLLLARWTIVAKPNFLARTLPPHFTQACLEEFDQAVVETVEHRTQLHFDEFSRAMLQLPIRLGGVGLCPSAETAPTPSSQASQQQFQGLWASATWSSQECGRFTRQSLLCKQHSKSCRPT